jgi:hypothetical protein
MRMVREREPAYRHTYGIACPKWWGGFETRPNLRTAYRARPYPGKGFPHHDIPVYRHVHTMACPTTV